MRHYINKYKESTNRKSLIEEAMKASVQYQLRYAINPEEKRALIASANPLLHIFGAHQLPALPYEDYTDWVEKQYPDTELHHITSVEDAREYLNKLRTTEVHDG